MVIRTSTLIISVLLAAATARAAGDEGARRLARAEQAYVAGRYDEVLAQLPAPPATGEMSPRAWILHAHAHFKLGQLAEARRDLDALIATSPGPEATLLRAMVAHELADWDAARRDLRAVVATGEEPWVRTARKLLATVAASQAREAEARRKRAALERRQRHDQLIALARTELEAGRLGAAKKLIDRADRTRPGQLEAHYYRGYIAYQRGDYPAAHRQFAAALAVDELDGWSRYMLALTTRRRGDTPAARRMLAALARGATDADVRRESRAALALLESRAAHARRSEPRLRLEVGSGLDTNPAFLDELPATIEDAALGIELAGGAGHAWSLPRGLALELGVGAAERLYAGGGAGAEHTRADAGVALSLELGPVDATAGYDYTFSMYGHAPLMSAHGGHVEVGYLIKPWLRAALGGGAGWRHVHDADYTYLEGINAGGAAALALRLGSVECGVSYRVSRDWSDPVLASFTTQWAKKGSTGGNGRGGATSSPATRTVELETDYSYTGHGPRAWAVARLPWRLELAAHIGVELRSFDSPDVVPGTSGSAPITLEPRSDTRLSASARLLRRLPRGFAVGLQFDSVDNFSSVERTDLGIDRNYARRQIGLAASWRWGAPHDQGPAPAEAAARPR